MILNPLLKKNAIDYVRPRYIQLSKTDTIKGLKEKIRRCIKGLFEKKIEIKNFEEIELNQIKLYKIIYGIKKRRREILKLLYAYHENSKRFNISGEMIKDEDILLEVLNNFF